LGISNENDKSIGIKFRKRQPFDFIIDSYITVFWCADYEYDNDNRQQGHFQG